MSDDRPPNPLVLGGCVYYSQNREDLILLAFFHDVPKGFYVDVGAFDPDLDSVTKLFYLKGWKGINIEPQADRHQLFVKDRPRDINLNIGIASEPGELVLRAYKSQGLATFSETVKHDYAAAPDADTKEYTESTVKLQRLKDVLAERNVKHIHFMKVDVEGFEFEVLSSNDWVRFRPEVLCIEADHIKHDWRPLLKQQDYELAFDDGLNEYYVDARTNRKAKFQYVKEVVRDRGGGIRADHFQLLADWRTFGIDKANHVDELARENERLSQRLAVLERQVSSFRRTAKQLMRLAARRVRPKQ